MHTNNIQIYEFSKGNIFIPPSEISRNKTSPAFRKMLSHSPHLQTPFHLLPEHRRESI